MSEIPNDVRQLRGYGDTMADAVADAGAQVALDFDPVWAEAARAWIVKLARSGVEFTADDLRDRVGDPSSSGAIGAVLRAAASDDLIRHTGYRRSRRVSRHAGVIGVWVGNVHRDREGASSGG